MASRRADSRSTNSTRLPRNRMSQRPFWFSRGSWQSLREAEAIGRLTAPAAPCLTRDGLAMFRAVRTRHVDACGSPAFGSDARDLVEPRIVADALQFHRELAPPVRMLIGRAGNVDLIAHVESVLEPDRQQPRR